MPDPFQLLGLPRAAWLDAGEIRRAFQERARDLHPDRAGGDAGRFAELNAAHAVLADPASRLRELIGNRAPVPAMPPDIELGFRVAETLREADQVMGKTAGDPLGRALLATERRAVLRKLDALAEKLAGDRADAERRLKTAEVDSMETLAAFAGEFTFLNRWTAQVRQRRLDLSLS